jgi:hypothetical protein
MVSPQMLVALLVLGVAVPNTLVVDAKSRQQVPRRKKRKLQGTLKPAFFGEDLNPGNVRKPLTVFPKSKAAQAAFFAGLNAPETENFEDFSLNTRFPIVSTSFKGLGDVTLTGAATAMISETLANDQLRYSTSGTKFLDVNANDDFFMSLPQPIVGFGFFATDIGDVLGTLTVETQLKGGNVKRYTIPHTVARGADGADGAVMYAGEQVLSEFVGITDRHVYVSSLLLHTLQVLLTWKDSTPLDLTLSKVTGWTVTSLVLMIFQ